MINIMKKKLLRKTITIPEDIYSDIKQLAAAKDKAACDSSKYN